MKSLTDFLSQTLISGSKIELDCPSTLLKIKNSDNDGKLKLVKIDVIENNDSFFAFTLDNKPIKNKKNTEIIITEWINQKTDGILYKYHNKEHLFILIEVKTENPSGCEKQLKSMEAFLAYLIKVIELEHNTLEISGKIKIARLLITSRPTSNKPHLKNDRGVPYNEKINANEIQYKIEYGQRPIPLTKLLDCRFNPLFKFK